MRARARRAARAATRGSRPRSEPRGIPASKIYVTEYPNATRDAQRRDLRPADPLPGQHAVRLHRPGHDHAGRGGRGGERAAASPVNAALKAAAATYGWHLVSGIASQSTTHGLCATRPWFVGVSESLITQHDVLGTLHPNRQGQQAIAGLVVSALKP